jgi:hypothetical protein
VPLISRLQSASASRLAWQGFYLVQLLIQRTPLVPPEALAREPEPPEPRSGPAGPWDRRPGG